MDRHALIWQCLLPRHESNELNEQCTRAGYTDGDPELPVDRRPSCGGVSFTCKLAHSLWSLSAAHPRTGRQDIHELPAGPGHAQREPQLSPRPPDPTGPMVRFPLAPGEGLNTVSRTGLLHAPNDSYTAVWPSAHPIPPGAAAPRPPAKTAPNPNLSGTRTSLISKASSVSYTRPPIHACTRARVTPRLVSPDSTPRPLTTARGRQRENTVIVF